MDWYPLCACACPRHVSSVAVHVHLPRGAPFWCERWWLPALLNWRECTQERGSVVAHMPLPVTPISLAYRPLPLPWPCLHQQHTPMHAAAFRWDVRPAEEGGGGALGAISERSSSPQVSLHHHHHHAHKQPAYVPCLALP